jgi:hypothetical protein
VKLRAQNFETSGVANFWRHFSNEFHLLAEFKVFVSVAGFLRRILVPQIVERTETALRLTESVAETLG